MNKLPHLGIMPSRWIDKSRQRHGLSTASIAVVPLRSFGLVAACGAGADHAGHGSTPAQAALRAYAPTRSGRSARRSDARAERLPWCYHPRTAETRTACNAWGEPGSDRLWRPLPDEDIEALLADAPSVSRGGLMVLQSPREFFDEFVLPTVAKWEADPLNVRKAMVAISRIDILSDQVVAHQNPNVGGVGGKLLRASQTQGRKAEKDLTLRAHT
jgi:hypothetical protein